MNFEKYLNESIRRDIIESNKLEEKYFLQNEIKIDASNTHQYKEIQLSIYDKSYSFEDRCGNILVAVYMDSVKEFKVGYKIEGEEKLVFEPEKLQNPLGLVTPCADDKKISTIYKILSQEIIPKYTMSRKPNKVLFNPVSLSRKRITDTVMNRIVKDFPEISKKGNYLIYI